METYQNLKKNSVISALSLFFQSGFSAVLGLVANLVLTILLTPTVFGIYFTVLSLISLLNYFSDIGLAASLIQKKEITEEDVKTTFTVQQILIVSIIFCAFLSTPFIIKFYNLPLEGKYLYWALLFSFFLSSLKTIPSVFLERKIQFQKIVLVQIAENAVFYLSVIIFALFNLNLTSFTYAVILRSLIGVILIYYFSFWIPRLGISFKHLKSLLSFGAPFQASSLLALFKDDLITLYLGKTLGFTALGYIGWAKKWAEAPLRIIMDNISRVLFPLISRLQNDKNKITQILEKIFHYQTLILAPCLAGLVLIMPILIFLIPKYEKWQPALPLFYLFCLSSFFSSYSTPFINLFNALGKAKISFSFMFLWTIMAWVLTTIFTFYFHSYGFPISQLLISTSFIFVVLKTKKLLKFNFFSSVYKPLISALIMALFLIFFSFFLSYSYLSLIIKIILGALIYFFALYFLFKINIIAEIHSLFTYEK